MLAALFSFSVQTICFRQFNRYFMKNLTSYFIFNTLFFTIVSATYIVVKPSFNYHSYSIIFGVIFGLLFVATMFFYMKGMETGPLSYTSLLYSLGLIIPVIFGLLFWGERMGMLQVTGLLLLLITIYLGSGSGSPAAPEKGMNLRWLVFTFVAFLGNGFLMTITKAHQVLMPGKQVMEFLFICFATATVSSFILAIAMFLFKKQDTRHLKDRNFVLVVIGTGVTTAVGNMIMFILAGRMDGVVLYPVVCGGGVVLSSIASLLLFKEKMAKKGYVGLAIGMVALICLSLK